MSNENIEKLRQILEHYGTIPQIGKLREELKELDEAAADYVKFPCFQNKSHFLEELADVTIMVEQMKISLNLDEQAEYYKWVEYKINRQIGRIANEKS